MQKLSPEAFDVLLNAKVKNLVAWIESEDRIVLNIDLTIGRANNVSKGAVPNELLNTSSN